MVQEHTSDTRNRLTSDIEQCTACDLHKYVTHKVVGKGDWNADLLFVGEAPGRHEDEMGEPFVGAAGNMLDLLLQVASFKRSEVFISNILHCRPPSNRTPLSSEIFKCTDFLYRTINIVQPKIIVPMGNTATHFICNTQQPISKIHGTTHKSLGYHTIIPIYHPAALIYNASLIDGAKEDMKVIKRTLKNLSQ